MALEAHVQGRFPFLGIMRKPGDVLTADDLAQTTPQMRDALVGQKLIVLQREGTPASEGERYDHAMARIDALQTEVAALKAASDQPSALLVAAIRDVAQRAVADAVKAPKARGRAADREAI